MRAADPQHWAALFRRYAACHSIDRGTVDLNGPNLRGVVGNAVAARRPRYAYRFALRGIGGSCSFERLDAWLAKPAAFPPGTKMSFDGSASPRDRADLIAFLNSQGSGMPFP